MTLLDIGNEFGDGCSMSAEMFDVIVAGLGAMGSAAVWQFARRGLKVVGIDQFSPPHTFGSSHGHTRIIREAYFEHPVYVPLVQRAYELWHDLETESGQKLFVQTGGLMVGAPDSVVFGGAKRSAETHRLQHEILTAREVTRRFPGITPDENMMAVWEPRAGFLYPEECIRAQLKQALARGCALRCNEKILNWRDDGGEVLVETSAGRYRAKNLVVTAGAWLQQMVPELALPLRIERQILFWFATTEPTSDFRLGHCPVHLWQYGPDQYFYGFPDVGQGVKVALHHQGVTAHPDTVNREVTEAEVRGMREVLARFLPRANGALSSTAVCLYTNTPDGHFLIDRHPNHPRVLVASPCSGHGFKFASAIGEMVCDLVIRGESRFDSPLFHWPRHAIQAGPICDDLGKASAPIFRKDWLLTGSTEPRGRRHAD